MVEIADIIPSPRQTNDRLLIRRGASSPYTLELLDAVPEPTSITSVPPTTIKGRNVAGTGPLLDLTPTEVTAMLDLFSNTAKGLAPPSGGLATEVLRGNGTWGAAPLDAEIVASRYSLASLNLMLRGLMRAASGQAVDFTPTSGRYYTNRRGGGGVAVTLAGVAGRFDLTPWYVPFSFTPTQFGIEVTTLIAAALAKVQIYAALDTGYPGALLAESGDLDCSTTGYKFFNPGITLEAGKWYWFGLRTSSTATSRALPVSDSWLLERGSTGAGSSVSNLLRRTLAYATPSPNPFGAVAGADHNQNNATQFHWRIA